MAALQLLALASLRCTKYTHAESDSIMGFVDTVGPFLTYIATGLVLSRVRGLPGTRGFWQINRVTIQTRRGGQIIPTTLLLGTRGSKILTP